MHSAMPEMQGIHKPFNNTLDCANKPYFLIQELARVVQHRQRPAPRTNQQRQQPALSLAQLRFSQTGGEIKVNSPDFFLALPQHKVPPASGDPTPGETGNRLLYIATDIVWFPPYAEES